MKIQFGNNLKIFITSNIDSDGKILTTGLNSGNTRELLLIQDSLNLEYTKSYNYIDTGNLIDSDNMLSVTGSANISTGTLGFSTHVNSSQQGPLDTWLWNSLITSTPYPNTKWSIEENAHTLNLVRTENNVYRFGIILVLPEITYVVNDIRVSQLELSFDMDGLAINNWSLNFSNFTQLTFSASLSEVNGVYALSGGLSGNVQKLNHSNYTYSTGKFIRTHILNTSGVKLGTIAVTSANFSISNSLSYLDSNTIDTQELKPIFTTAGTQTVGGSFSMYTRGPGSYSHSLISSLINTAPNPYIFNNYGIIFELMKDNSNKLLEIQLLPCNLSCSSTLTSALTNSIDYQLVQPNLNMDCYVKFYT